MREYSKKVNLIQIINKKIEVFNAHLERINQNTVYNIENVDVNVNEVKRMLDDIDHLVENIEDDKALDSYLQVRHYLDKLRRHIRKTNKLKESQAIDKKRNL